MHIELLLAAHPNELTPAIDSFASHVETTLQLDHDARVLIYIEAAGFPQEASRNIEQYVGAGIPPFMAYAMSPISPSVVLLQF